MVKSVYLWMYKGEFCLLGRSSNLAKVMWQNDSRECNVTQHARVPLYISASELVI